MLISNKQLKKKLDTRQDAQIIKWLNERHIKWDRDTKKKPITTQAAIDSHILKETSSEVDF